MARRLLQYLALAGVVGWLLVGGAQAQTFTLTDNGWTYSGDIGVQSWLDFVDPNQTDHMHQNW